MYLAAHTVIQLTPDLSLMPMWLQRQQSFFDAKRSENVDHDCKAERWLIHLWQWWYYIACLIVITSKFLFFNTIISNTYVPYNMLFNLLLYVNNAYMCEYTADFICNRCTEWQTKYFLFPCENYLYYVENKLDNKWIFVKMYKRFIV